MDIPKISVVIPALNEEKYISYCLTSLLNQTIKAHEIIVADGESKDQTVSIAQQMGAKVLKVIKGNVTIARNRGAKMAQGNIIVCADADTIYNPDHLEKIIGDYRKDKDIVCVGGIGKFEKNPWWMYMAWELAYYFCRFINRISGLTVYIPAYCMSYTKEVFESIKGYREYLDFGGDEIDILSRLKKRGRVYFDPTLRPHPSSRRSSVGFFSIFIKHTLIDYYLNLLLAGIFKKTIIRGKPIR